MNILKREQIMDVLLNECIDEFGNTFGKNGNHFFIQVLQYHSNIGAAKKYLKKYYEENLILSVNQVLGKKTKSKLGEMYYCPWDEGRIRPLSKFIQSHKVGPTPDIYIEKIIKRLFNLFFKIKSKGFQKFFKLNNFPRCFKIKVNKQNHLYLCRDGQHRLAVLSYLGYERVKICYEADFWDKSNFISLLLNYIRPQKNKMLTKQLKIIDPNLASDWPHVKAQNITEEEAVKYFFKKFKLNEVNND